MNWNELSWAIIVHQPRCPAQHRLPHLFFWRVTRGEDNNALNSRCLDSSSLSIHLLPPFSVTVQFTKQAPIQVLGSHTHSYNLKQHSFWSATHIYINALSQYQKLTFSTVTWLQGLHSQVLWSWGSRSERFRLYFQYIVMIFFLIWWSHFRTPSGQTQ